MIACFRGAESFNRDISTWDVDQVTSLYQVFWGATSFNQDISMWDVMNVTSMSRLFLQASSFDQDLSAWDIGSLDNGASLFSYSGMSKENYDLTIIGWNAQDVIPGVTIGAIDLLFCEGESARENLMSSDGWSFLGDMKDCIFKVGAGTLDMCDYTEGGSISTAAGNTNIDVDFFDGEGDILFTINANGNELGDFFYAVYVSSVNRVYGSPIMRRDVTIIPTSQPTTPVSVKIYYTQAEYNALLEADPSITDYADIGFTKNDQLCTGTYDGGGLFLPQTDSGIYNSATGDIYIETSVSSFSTFFGQRENTVLPVDLISFQAEKLDDQVKVLWVTASEINHDFFEVQHAVDGVNFTTVDKVSGINSRSNISSYQSYHDNPSHGFNYYRLKQVDLDGSYSFSEIVSVRYGEGVNPVAYPNPVSNTIYFNDLDGGEYEIYSQLGKLLDKGSISALGVDVSDLASGVYYITMRSGIQSINQKIIKN